VTSVVLNTGASVTLLYDGSAWVQAAGNNSIGYGQSWVDLIGSRTTGVNYTNTTGRPIQVAIRVASASGQIWNLTITGVAVQSYSTSGIDGTIFAVIPPGAVYILTGATAINSWKELC